MASPLHRAAENGDLGEMRRLIDMGYNVNDRDNKNRTPLHVAALSGREEVVLALITELSCDINVKGYLGQSLLHYACNGGNISLVKTLILKYKADINVRDD